MTAAYRNGFLLFGALKCVSIFLHYLGPSPYGDKQVLGTAFRLIPSSVILELGIIACICGIFLTAHRIWPRWPKTWVLGCTAMLTFNFLIGQIDSEVYRWLAIHVSFNYLQTYIFNLDTGMASRILSGDIWLTAIAFVLFFISVGFAVRLNLSKASIRSPGLWQALLLVLALAGMTSPLWFMKARSRLRRIMPPVYGLTGELLENFSPRYKIQDPDTARADFQALMLSNRPAADNRFPLMRTSRGPWTPNAFRGLPDSLRPDIYVFLVESLRGWKTGLLPDSTLPSATARLDSFARESAAYFPWSHSNGYPSPEGLLGIHLGLLPHARKNFLSQFFTANTLSLPEIFRKAGYATMVMTASDPGFDNITVWLQRWYGDMRYEPAVTEDEPLLEEFKTAFRRRPAGKPVFYTVLTATMHPSYMLPSSEGVTPAETSEGRYDQVIAYTEKHLMEAIDLIRQSPDWSRSLILIMGDHAQPTPFHRLHYDDFGGYTPGHSWTNLIIAGGWPLLPPPGMRTRQVSQVDIGPTLLKLTGIRVRHHFMGSDIFNTPESPINIFYNKAVVRYEGNSLYITNLETGAGVAAVLDRQSGEGYGILGYRNTTLNGLRPLLPDISSRMRNAALHYSKLIEDNRIFQP